MHGSMGDIVQEILGVIAQLAKWEKGGGRGTDKFRAADVFVTKTRQYRQLFDFRQI